MDVSRRRALGQSSRESVAPRAAERRRLLEDRSRTSPSPAATSGSPTTSRRTNARSARSSRCCATSSCSGGVYMGVGPEQNFSYIAAIRPAMAFIVDIRRQAVMQHLMFKADLRAVEGPRRLHLAAVLESRGRRARHARRRSSKIWDAFPIAPTDCRGRARRTYTRDRRASDQDARVHVHARTSLSSSSSSIRRFGTTARRFRRAAAGRRPRRRRASRSRI